MFNLFAKLSTPFSCALFRGIAFCLFLFLCGQSHARETIVFSCPLTGLGHIKQEMNDIYSQAFDALGKDFVMRDSPALRSPFLMASGKVDGECSRTIEFKENSRLDNIILIDVPIVKLHVEVWARKLDQAIPASTVLGPDVGYWRGFVWVKTWLEKKEGVNIMPSTETLHGLKMLAAGRMNHFIGSSLHIRNAMKNTELEGLIYKQQHINSVLFYPYLNSSRSALAKPLRKELEKLMRSRGGPIQ